MTAGAQPLPPRFLLAMPDDSLAPTTPKGTVLICSTGVAPAVGAGVLIEDAAGQRYVRRLTRMDGPQWTAEARRTGFQALSNAPGMVLRAVVVGRQTGEV
ncbi:MAG TPA: hypothetical protein PK306_02605 [Aquabacterium sp.]|nr:hypothetical protein [Aquabacterium sp.]HQC94583.1 hypothetical protein [Aquabacterium sp.]